MTSRYVKTFWIVIPWILLLATGFLFWWVLTQLDPDRKPEIWSAPQSSIEPAKPLGVISFHDAVAKTANSVVNIYTTTSVDSSDQAIDPMIERFFGEQFPNQSRESANLGSGVVVSEDGFIVTNAHVIAGADDIKVNFNDGTEARAQLIGADAESDLAVIRVSLKGLKPLPFKKSEVRVGDIVLAIGNPFGVGQTVTQGIISATGRSGLGINTFEDFIQTDAAINPGNSGGALIDLNGQLVGINTAIFSRSGGNNGIGFAIPTVLIEQVMRSIIRDGKVTRGWLGIEVGIAPSGSPAALSIARAQKGVLVGGVMAGGPADLAGLRKGDIIQSLNGLDIKNANQLIQYISRQKPNQSITAGILRNAEPLQISIVLGERPTQQSLLNSQLESQPAPNNQKSIPNDLRDFFDSLSREE